MTATLATPPAAPGAAPSAEVARARVAVLVATHQVDVVIPTKFPVETFMDDLLAVLQEAIDDEELDFVPPTGQWSLARPGDSPIPRWRTLAEHNIDDGTVLMLCPVESSEVFTPIVEDITDALALINEREFAEFDANTAAITGLATWCIGTLAVSFYLMWMWLHTGSFLVCAIPALVLGVLCWAAALLTGRLGSRSRTALALSLSAIPPLFAGGAMLVPPMHDEPLHLTAANLAAGAVVAAVSAATMIRLTSMSIATLTAVATLGAILAAAALPLTYMHLKTAQVSAGAVLVSLLLLTQAPRIAVFVARIRPPDLPDPGDAVSESSLSDIFGAESEAASADQTLDDDSKKTQVGTESRARLAVTTLRGLVAALSAITAAATIICVKAEPGGIRDIIMAVAVTGVLVLRARWFPDRVQALAFIAAAVVIVVGAGGVLFTSYTEMVPRLVVLVVILVIAALGSIAAVRLPGVRMSPVTRQMIDLVEYALLVIVPVLAFWIMGIYTRMRRI